MTTNLKNADLNETFLKKLIVVPIAIIFFFFAYYQFVVQDVNVTAKVTNKVSSYHSKQAYYRIETDKGIFYDDDNMFFGKFRGGQYYKQIQVGGTYIFHVKHDKYHLVIDDITGISTP